MVLVCHCLRKIRCSFYLLVALAVFGCEKSPSPPVSSPSPSPTTQAKRVIRVGMVFDAAGKDDKSFNSVCWEGALRAKNDFGVELREVEPDDPSAVEPAIRAFAQSGFDLIVGVGGGNAEFIENAAKSFPQVHFAVVDDANHAVTQPNAASLTFDEHEGAFLVGMIAAKKSQTGVIGFVGGMDIPLLHKFLVGYEEGAKYVNPQIKVLANFAGLSPAAWNDRTKGKELAKAQYAQGAEVIFAAAGYTGLGVFDAAEEDGKFVIGVDANQNYIKPGHVLTSMLKRSDVAVYETIKQMVEGRFQGGRRTYNLASDGLGYAVDEYNRDLLPAGIVEEVEAAKRAIIAGEIRVTDYTKRMKDEG